MNARYKISFAVLSLIAMSAASIAQSSVTGAIGGTVTDPNKAVVPNATVTVRNIDTNKEATATTDSEGRFRVVELQPGSYSVKVNLQYFNPFEVNNIVVEVGRVTTVDAELSLKPADFGIVEISNTPVINTTHQDFSANINQTSINELPINGRRWSNFAMGTPSAAPDGPFGLLSFRGISSLFNNNTVDGGDNNQAFFSEERGRTRISYVISLDSIREFQVNASNYSAEYGRAAGGVVNAVTKSGTNRFHGSAFYYLRHSNWGARNPRGFQNVLINGVATLIPLKPVDIRHQFGGTVGGPILKNRLFFFFSYDQQKRNFPGIATPSDPAFFTTVNRGTTVAGLKAPNRLLTDAQIDSTVAFLTSLLGEVPRRGDQKIFLPKIDWEINSKNTLTGTYNRMRWQSPAGIQTGATVAFGRQSFGDDFANVDSFNLRLLSRIGPALVNEARFQYGRDNEFEFSQTPAAGEPLTGPNGKPPAISITGGLTFGKPTFLERRAFPDEKRWQNADTVTLSRDKHTFKFGFDFNHVKDVLDNLNTEEGSYAYSSINDFIMDYVNFTTAGSLRTASRVCAGSTRIAGQCYNGNFLQAFGPTAFNFNTNDYNFFFQDDFQVSSRLTLNLGLRYEYEQLPKPQIPNALTNLAGLTFGPEQTNTFPSDKNNFGPRLGLAYDVKGNAKTSIRGGYGIYYGRIINSTVSNAITNTGVTQAQRLFQINPATTPASAPVFPNTLSSASGTTTPPNIVGFDPKMNNPLIHEGDIVFERLIARNTVVSASYLFSFGRNLPTFTDFNLPAPTTRTYTISGGDLNGQSVTVPFFAGPRPDTRFGGTTAIRSLIRSKYNALVLQISRRLTNGLQFDSSHTLSKATDNGQTSATFTATNTPFNPLDLSLDEAPSNFDTRHKFTASLIWSPKSFNANRKVERALFNGFTFAPIFIAISGSAYSAGTSGNPAGGVSSGLTAAGSVLNHVPLFSRNFFRQPKIWNLDMRISRRFQLTEKMNLAIVAEVFNLFNRTLVTSVNTRLYIIGGTATASTLTFDPAFGTTSSAGNTLGRERQIQLAVRFQF
jgi:hypothetical protein